MPLSPRQQELVDAARCVGPSHRDRVLYHMDEAINAIGTAAHHLSEAESWWSIGALKDEISGLADLLADIRGRKRAAEEGRS